MHAYITTGGHPPFSVASTRVDARFLPALYPFRYKVPGPRHFTIVLSRLRPRSPEWVRSLDRPRSSSVLQYRSQTAQLGRGSFARTLQMGLSFTALRDGRPPPRRSRLVNLDVVLCTYNRSALLRKAAESLLRAPVPEGLNVNIFVIDNNSPDDTAQVVRELQAGSALPVHYVRETKQGLSNARNAGIAAGKAELIGFIDDDEEIETSWYQVIAREFEDPTVDFIGGPYLPNWQAPAPAWLPPGYHAVVGAIPPKQRGRYGNGHPGMLNGGNGVLRRSVFDRVGTYSPLLGRTPKGLLSDEDAELFGRILAAGISGMYVPDLAIHHFIPVDRLTKKYHRRWVYWRAVSQGVLDRNVKEPVSYLLGVPRHRIGYAIRSLLRLPGNLIARRRGEAFADELATWNLLGFLHGKFFVRIESYYTKKG